MADRWCDGGLGSEHECFNSHPVRLYGPLGVQRTYIGAADPTDPLVSPMRGDLSGLPQTLLFDWRTRCLSWWRQPIRPGYAARWRRPTVS